jgi:pimeloyl-ACP methyl ester carboxylesterase
MPYITVGQENSGPIELYYEDHGSGRPVVLIHGWPLSGASWEKQARALLQAGYRVITYDRRGFGKSSQPTSGYDYDTMSADLDKLMTKLDLKDAAIFGFSMGGGEVARYLGTYGAVRVAKAGFLGAIPPFLLKTADNPTGADASVFDGIQAAIVQDRPGFLAQFFQNFYNVDVFGGKRISDQALQLSWNVAAAASPTGTHDCVKAWLTDFRADLAKIKIPVLVVHGEDDRIVPFAGSGKLTHSSIPGSKLVAIQGGPHGILWTHGDEVAQAMLEFLK